MTGIITSEFLIGYIKKLKSLPHLNFLENKKFKTIFYDSMDKKIESEIYEFSLDAFKTIKTLFPDIEFIKK